MIFTIDKKYFPDIEMLLFSLVFPCHCKIQINFTDSNESYAYKTIEYCGKIVLVTDWNRGLV